MSFKDFGFLDDGPEEGKRGGGDSYSPWAGKRSGGDYSPWAGKRSGPNTNSNGRQNNERPHRPKKFLPWAGKRSSSGQQQRRMQHQDKALFYLLDPSYYLLLSSRYQPASATKKGDTGFNWDRMKKSNFNWDRMKRSNFNWDRMKKSNFNWDRMKRGGSDFAHELLQRLSSKMPMTSAEGEKYNWDRMGKRSGDNSNDKKSDPYNSAQWERMN